MLSVFIPERAHDIQDSDDLNGLVTKLRHCRNRRVLFSGETVSGFVIQPTTRGFDNDGGAEPVNLTVSYSDDTVSDVGEETGPDLEGLGESSFLDAPGTRTTARPIHVGKTDSDDIGDDALSVWRFEAQIMPSGCSEKSVCFTACGTNGESGADRTSGAGGAEDNSVSLRLPLAVAATMRVKSTKPGGRNDLLLASVAVEPLDLAGGIYDTARVFLRILQVDVSFRAGKLEPMASLSLPRTVSIHDAVNATFKLVNNSYLDSQIKHTDALLATAQPLNVALRMQVVHGNEECPTSDAFIPLSNVIVSEWSPILDFGLVAPPISNSLKSSNNISHFQSQSQFQLPLSPSPSLNLLRSPQLGFQRKPSMVTSASASASVIGPHRSRAAAYRIKLPVPGRTQLASALSHMAGQTSSLVGKFAPPLKKSSFKLNTPTAQAAPPKLPLLPASSSAVTVNLTTASNSSLSGLRLTFQGRLNVDLGKIILWKVQAINHSQHTMHLSLIVKNPLNFHPIYPAPAPTSTAQSFSSSNLLGEKASDSERVIVLSRQNLYSQYQQLKLETSGVIVLTNDIRLGPIEPNAVFESEFEIIGISKGVFTLHGLKIFDMATGDGIDFGKLVEVFVM